MDCRQRPVRTRGAWYCAPCTLNGPRRGKGDVRGQKRRWKARRRKVAKLKVVGRLQWRFDVTDYCRACGAAVDDGRLFCDTVTCDPGKYRKRRRFRRK